MDIDSKKTSEHDYEIQFFGFTPDSFANGGKLQPKEIAKVWPKSKSSRELKGKLVLAIWIVKTNLIILIWIISVVYNAVNDYVIDCFQELENLVKSEASICSKLQTSPQYLTHFPG